MNTGIRSEPIYIFQLTPELSLIWTALGSLLLIVTLLGAGWFYGMVHGQSLSFSLVGSENNFGQVVLPFLGFLAIVFGTIVVHEFLHGIAFAAFGGSPRYGFKFKFFLPLAYATSPGDLFRRNQFIIIGLAPLVVIDVACLFLLVFFPQLSWLIWVIAFNTAGAVGDIWVSIQLLRCPKSIRVEDREEGIAIYAPPYVTSQQLPFSINIRPRSGLGKLLNWMLMAIVLIVSLGFLLIPILHISGIPSFIIGTDNFWILRWDNTPQGFGIRFNFSSILIVIIIMFFTGILISKLKRII